MSAERDELEPPYLVGVTDDFPGGNDDDLVEWAFEAGMKYQAWQSKPQQVTTVEELDALPVGSVLLDKFGTVWRVASEVTDGTEGRYEGASGNVYFTTGVFAPLMGPFTVLHVGGSQ